MIFFSIQIEWAHFSWRKQISKLKDGHEIVSPGQGANPEAHVLRTTEGIASETYACVMICSERAGINNTYRRNYNSCKWDGGVGGAASESSKVKIRSKVWAKSSTFAKRKLFPLKRRERGRSKIRTEYCFIYFFLQVKRDLEKRNQKWLFYFENSLKDLFDRSDLRKYELREKKFLLIKNS